MKPAYLRTRWLRGIRRALALALALTALAGFVNPRSGRAAEGDASPGLTTVTIGDGGFRINGRPTYPGRTWRGHPIEGLLLNSRMVQGIFDDLNPETAGAWAYPDTRRWDPERNTREFIAAMPEWRRHGLLAFTLNLQGGSPQGYSRDQPWHNSAIDADGSLRPDYLARLRRILDKADELGMVVILGYFYFDYRMQGEGIEEGYQSVPVDWGIHSARKRGFFELLSQITGAK